MNKLEILKLKKEIYQTIYDGIILEPKYIVDEMDKIDAQIEVLEDLVEGSK